LAAGSGGLSAARDLAERGYEVKVFLDTPAGLSRRVKVIRRVLPCETLVLNRLLIIFRDLAWAFAHQLAAKQARNSADISIHDSWAALLGTYYVFPTEGLTRIARWIADEESTDVAANIRAFEGVT
jgi:hypothetical protein